MYIRKVVIYICLFVAAMLQRNGVADAIPHLQLYISGASYTDETWVYPGNSFDLQVISTKEGHSNVYVSAALVGIAQDADLSSVSINFGSETYTGDDFTWGRPGNISPHGVFDTYYVQIPVGNFGTGETVCNMVPGNEGDCKPGEAKDFSVTINSPVSVDFDAYTLKANGNIDEKAPFSHDAAATGTGATTPEPTTIALLSMGIACLLGYKARRFLRKS